MILTFAMKRRAADETELKPMLAPHAELEDASSLYLSGLSNNEAHRR